MYTDKRAALGKRYDAIRACKKAAYHEQRRLRLGKRTHATRFANAEKYCGSIFSKHRLFTWIIRRLNKHPDEKILVGVFFVAKPLRGWKRKTAFCFFAGAFRGALLHTSPETEFLDFPQGGYGLSIREIIDFHRFLHFGKGLRRYRACFFTSLIQHIPHRGDILCQLFTAQANRL